MFMTQNDGEIDTILAKKKKPSKKTAKSVKKAAPKKAAKDVKAKTKKPKVTKAAVKKVLKPKKLKPKSYKVSGSFAISPEGNVLKKTKSIELISIGKKQVTVTFIVKLK